MSENNIDLEVSNLNLANSIYEGFNDKGGLMICGYEWGEENGDNDIEIKVSEKCTFSNKVPRYGDVAKTWVKYDGRIRAWFKVWGEELDVDGEGSFFDKCIIQTNWSLGSRGKSLGLNYYLREENVDNFIVHVDRLRPSLIFFMGNQLLTKCLKHYSVRDRFQRIFGSELDGMSVLRMDGYNGPLAYIQRYDNCIVVGLPHPSGSRGLKNEYIKYLSKYISPIINEYKVKKINTYDET